MIFLLARSFFICFIMGKQRKASPDIVSRDYTVNLHTKLAKITFKKRAPRAIREIKKFAAKMMGTKDVRIDTNLNKFIWSQGIRTPPRRVRVRLHRLRNDAEEEGETLYTHVEYVFVPSFKGLGTTNSENA